MKFRAEALFDKAIVKRVEIADKSPQTIILIDQGSGGTIYAGEVVSIGPGIATPDGFIKSRVEEGQTVLFAPQNTGLLELDGEKYFVMAEQQIIGILYDNN